MKKTGKVSGDSVKAAPARNTDSGPASIQAVDQLSEKSLQTETLAAGRPYNPIKAGEHGFDSGTRPAPGAVRCFCVAPSNRQHLVRANSSAKTGTEAVQGNNACVDTLDRVRVDAAGQVLTTNQGVAIADNQNSLKYASAGPFCLRTSFSAKRSPISTMSASPNASFMRAAPAPTASSSAMSRLLS